MVVRSQRMFGTNGVRFVPGVTHDLDFVIKLGEALGTYFGGGEILVGRDGRASSPALSNAVISGLLSSGRDVAEAGVVPTPALQYATRSMGMKGGVMVTASHNPPEYNGVKAMSSDGSEVARLDEQRIEKIFSDGSSSRADWKSVGVARQEPSVVATYIRGVLSSVDGRLVAGRRFTIVLDLGNGAQCGAAPYVAEALGCKVVTINSTIDGGFPGRGPEPTPYNLSDLSASVKAVGADLGVAYDGDGDRAIFCDETGRVMWGDQSACLLTDYLLEKNPGATVVTPVSSTQAVEAVAAKRGGKVLRTKVGSVDVSRTMIERRALFGFEENGGCIYSPHLFSRDGAMATAMMLECLAARGMAFSRSLAFSVPRYYQAKGKLRVDPKKRDSVLRDIERGAKGETERIDGLKIWASQQEWVLVRPSGTEPIIRVFAEAKSQEGADALLKKYLKAAKSASR
jgi:phosphomannomutase / phosphoglucomutase